MRKIIAIGYLICLMLIIFLPYKLMTLFLLFDYNYKI